MMMTDGFLFACVVSALVGDLVEGQVAYSSQPQPYDIPPGRVIDALKRQLEDDIYAVERKGELVSQRECLNGREDFNFCSLDLNLIDFIVCLGNPALSQGSDAFIRGIKFPSSAFGSTPVVAVAIAGIGTLLFANVKVESKDVYASGFNIVINGGNPAYPYSLTVQWIACPAPVTLEASVREFKPKQVPPPPPYFPINYSTSDSSATYGRNDPSSSGETALTHTQTQQRYDETGRGYEESSQSVDEVQPPNGQASQNPAPEPSRNDEINLSITETPANYDQTRPRYVNRSIFRQNAANSSVSDNIPSKSP